MEGERVWYNHAYHWHVLCYPKNLGTSVIHLSNKDPLKYIILYVCEDEREVSEHQRIMRIVHVVCLSHMLGIL